ncbi:Hypothetical predicted protein [Olea europaea subsp. europaea]|uniref:Uncharacterized protein n=1 Tax=Olea europaea subsp. europaea TaxID=158383 RepID=A0A8S0SDI2_OLEEU|nr:Hypothetical predicted protein [Olea europaea subsp. europaea]
MAACDQHNPSEQTLLQSHSLVAISNLEAKHLLVLIYLLAFPPCFSLPFNTPDCYSERLHRLNLFGCAQSPQKGPMLVSNCGTGGIVRYDSVTKKFAQYNGRDWIAVRDLLTEFPSSYV